MPAVFLTQWAFLVGIKIMLNLGLRAHDFGQGSATEIAERLSHYPDAQCIQLALAKSFPFIKEQAGQLSPGFAKQVRQAFAKKNINIAVLGCYINPIHPDAEIKEQSLLRFEEHLRFARDFGCSVVGTETGSKNPACIYHPESQSQAAFNELVDAIKRLADVAEKYGSIVGIEGVAHHHTLHNYDQMQRMLDKVASPNVQIIYDPVNFLPPEQTEQQNNLMTEAFERFADRMVTIHAKDFVLDAGIKGADLPAGEGILDYCHLFKLLKQYKPGIEIILESTGPDKAAEVIKFMQKAYQQA